jgi:hypothetical protein
MIMNTKKVLCLLSLLLALTLFLPCKGWSQMYPYFKQGGPNAPIITSTFAVEKGYYGYIWKIYIEAEDPDGEMLRIASVVNQVGVGHYPTDWIYLKSQYQKRFKGYIQWNTFSSRAPYLPEWTMITLTVSVIDKAGNESNQVVFPFTFEITPQQYAYKLPVPFDQGHVPRLGYIATELYYPGLGYGNGGDFH